MSIAISKIGFASVLAAVTVVACGSGENPRGFAEPVEGGYQAPPVGQENGSQPPNNLLACSPETGCQSCETPCHLCDCRFEGEQIDDNEYLLCFAAPNCVAALREYAGAAAGSDYGPEAQFLPGGEPIPVNQGCDCVDGQDCPAACNAPPGS
jgi:hypothetical protein